MRGTEVGAPPSPYKGLASFGEAGLDPLLFFGREREIEVIRANLIASRLTLLYGPSGVGKTSLLRAGVVPRLREEGGHVVVFSAWSGDALADLFEAVATELGRSSSDKPDPTPETLAAWTRELDGPLYVVLDQFEEYFLYHEAGGPFAELAEAVRDRDVRANFLISIREDALAQLDAFKAQVPNLFSNSLRLDRLDRAAAARAMLGPLERYRDLTAVDGPVEAEPAVVEEILDSVTAGRIQLGDTGRGGAEEPDDAGRIEAPYLQLVLERLWQVERERGSSVIRLETLHELGGAARIVEEHLERAMASLSSEEKDTAAAMYNHLVTPSGTKIAHRAGDLARYAAVDEAEAARVLDRLARERIVRASENGAGGPHYEIFHDVLADAVLGWRTQHEADRRLEAERLEASRRHQRLLALAGLSLLAVAVLAGIAIYALAQRGQAQDNAREARAGELVAEAAAALPTRPDRSVELALEASRIVHSPAVEDMLRKALSELRAISVTPVRGPAGEMALSRDGSRLAVASGDAVRIYGDGGARLLTTLPHPKVEAAVFSPDGSRIATVGRDGRARIWSRDGRLVRVIVHPGQVQSAAFSSNGRRLATVSQGRVVRVFDDRGRLVTRFVQRSPVMAIRFSPDGTMIATGGADKLARLWSASTGKVRTTLRGHEGRVGDVAFSPDGKLLATGSTDSTARVWRIGDASVVSILTGHDNFVSRVEFSPDGTLLATGSRDGRARIFKAESPKLWATLSGHEEAISDLAWSDRGVSLTTASSDGTVRTWSALPQPRPAVVRRLDGPVADVGFSRDSGDVVGAAGARAADPRLAEHGRLRAAIERVSPPSSIDFSPDGTRAVSAHTDGIARVWDAETGELVTELPRHAGPLRSATFSPDGGLVVTTGLDNVTRLSDARTGGQVWVRAQTSTVSDAAFSSDGRWVAVAGPGYASVFHVETGERILLLDGQDRVLTAVAFSPTGWRIATGGKSGAVRLYNCRLCGGIDDLVRLAEARLAGLSAAA